MPRGDLKHAESSGDSTHSISGENGNSSSPSSVPNPQSQSGNKDNNSNDNSHHDSDKTPALGVALTKRPMRPTTARPAPPKVRQTQLSVEEPIVR